MVDAAMPTAWLSLDRTDDDPADLLSHIAVALRGAGLMRSRNSSELHFTSDEAISHGISRLMRAIRSGSEGLVFLDNVDSLHNRSSIDVLGALLFQLGRRMQVVVASRSDRNLPMSALRSGGAHLEVTAQDLAFDEAEAAALLDAMGVDAGYDLGEVMTRTEGWPVGVHLTGLAMQLGSSEPRPLSVGGDDLFVADYMRSEVLDRLSPARVSFLVRTSILDQLSGPLCDAVLGTTGSGRVLEALEESNLLILRLDRTREWHRYHRMFQDLLQAELALRHPEDIVDLHARAAEWFEANHLPEMAIHHAQRAGDVDRVARIVADIGRATYGRGRSDTLLAWLNWLADNGEMARYPVVAAMGAMVSALSGDGLGAERWLGADEPRHPIARLARALQTRSGPLAMVEDARSAREELAPGSGFVPAAFAIEGMGTLWDGDVERADSLFAEAVTLSEPHLATAAATVALAERAVLAIDSGDWARANDFASKSLRHVIDYGLEGYATSALAFVVSARLARRRNDLTKARELLARAASLRPRLNAALPGYSVQALLEMATTYVELADVAGARQVLREAEDIVIQRPDLGLLPKRIEEIKMGLTPDSGRVGASALTNAELRLLPMLATHLSFPEIGERLFVSRHTVKTQAMSIYRKLGASSRSEAVRKAEETGLLGI
jgi:LuxR family maltose regulon positive regulatory protein